MGPPVIVWRSPSAEGSGMVSLAPVNNNVVNQLNAIADTPITLIQKGKFAAEHGDRARAKAYFDEAARADPGNTDLAGAYAMLGNMFDQGTQRVTVKPLVLPKQEFLKPMAQDKVNKYVIKDPQVKALRDAEVVAYNKLAVADAAFNSVSSGVQQGDAGQAQAGEAQRKLTEAVEEFKKAHEKLERRVYILDSEPEGGKP